MEFVLGTVIAMDRNFNRLEVACSVLLLQWEICGAFQGDFYVVVFRSKESVGIEALISCVHCVGTSLT